jgi:hypothetical protein
MPHFVFSTVRYPALSASIWCSKCRSLAPNILILNLTFSKSVYRSITWWIFFIYLLPYITEASQYYCLAGRVTNYCRSITSENIRRRIQNTTWYMGPYAVVGNNLTWSRLQRICHGQPYARDDLNSMPESTLSTSQGLRIWPQWLHLGTSYASFKLGNSLVFQTWAATCVLRPFRARTPFAPTSGTRKETKIFSRNFL